MLKQLKHVIDRANDEKNNYEQLEKKRKLELFLKARSNFDKISNLGKRGNAAAIQI